MALFNKSFILLISPLSKYELINLLSYKCYIRDNHTPELESNKADIDNGVTVNDTFHTDEQFLDDY